MTSRSIASLLAPARRKPPGLLLAVSCFALGLAGASAATITVTNLNDSGAGSLRQAIADSADGGTIDFSVSGVITLTNGALVVAHNIHISGPGAKNLTLDANNASQIITIQSGHTVAISGLTFHRGMSGNAGGAIFDDQSSLALDGCAFDANNALYGAAVAVRGSDSGQAALTARNCTFSNNVAGNVGGAVYTEAGNSGHTDVSFVNCTFSNNSVTSGSGGAIYSNAGNGGNSAIDVSHSTFSDNSATQAGDIYSQANGGAGTLTIDDTILKAGSAAKTITAFAPVVVTSNGYNLSSDDGGGFLTGTGDQINTDPTLDSLQDNGGPTLTHALRGGSPAFDAGDPNFNPNDFMPPLTTDQRGAGFPRVVNSIIDIGAYEANEVKVEFSAANYRVPENRGGVTLTLTRIGDLSQPATVHVDTADGSAHAGSDYSAVSNYVTIPAGEDAFSGQIAIFNDKAQEDTETFAVALTGTGSAELGPQATATVTIIDKDGPKPVIAFASATYHFKENAGSAELMLKRVGKQSTKVTVHFATSDGTAHSGGDYTTTSGDVIFTAGGSDTQTISIPIINDHKPEPDKTFQVTLSAAAGATLGTPHVTTVTIVDRD